MKVPLAAMVVIIALLVTPAIGRAQDVMRCGNTLIQPGDSKEKVRSACGEPTAEEGNNWIYANGATSHPRIVVFSDDGRVESIEVGR